MKTTILYQTTLNAVSQITQLKPNYILQSKTEEATNARYLLIQILALYLTDDKIATLIGITRQAANKARNHFQTRCRTSWELRQLYTEIQPIINAILQP